jgi:hypothetical protein
MALSKRLRRRVAGWLRLAMLFTQLAVAAHACSVADRLEPAVVAAMAQMPDCHDMDHAADPAQLQLCQAHCSNDAQSSARSLLPDLQPDPASMGLLVRLVEPPADLSLPRFLVHPESAVARGSPLPLYLALHVLRN